MELHRDWTPVERAAGPGLERAPLFQRLAWYRLLAEHAAPGGHLLALHGTGGTADAWLFLAIEGGIARSYANWYTLRFAASGGPEIALEAIARALRTMRPAVHRVELQPLDPQDPLPQAFSSAGWLTRIEPATANWRIDTKGMRFEDYWASRPSRLRNTAKRKAKAVDLAIEIHEHFTAEAWDAYEAVYARSWKPVEGSPAFLRALSEQEGAAGRLRLGIARLDGAPIAAQLWLVEDKVATIHKLAYVEEARDLSPGTLLSVAMFRHALDVDRVEEIDFGTGDDPYKAEWMGERRMLNRLVAFNPGTAAGLAGVLRSKAAELVRRARSH